jgi:hypothetical protein
MRRCFATAGARRGRQQHPNNRTTLPHRGKLTLRPNFYFHAATAYDILRHKGAPLGKLDYMGKLKVKS